MKKPTQRHPPKWLTQNAADWTFTKEALVKFGEVVTMVVLHTKTGGRLPILTPFRNDDHKAAITRLIRIMTLAHECKAVSVISESWVRQLSQRDRETEAEFYERSRAIAPSQAEDRIEVAMAILIYLDEAGERRSIHSMAEIVRDDAGAATGVKQRITSTGDQTAGAFLQMLDTGGHPPERIERARQMLAETGKELMDLLDMMTI